jgi:two-component system chemotaxis response regulator CheY
MQALVVDDSKAMRLILTRMLHDLGLEVHEASNGVEALQRIESGCNPEVMLVDWNMPEMTGIDFVEAVRFPPYESGARILMVTTETEVGNMVRALEAGADEYVMKPFTKEAILDKLRLVGIDV